MSWDLILGECESQSIDTLGVKVGPVAIGNEDPALHVNTQMSWTKLKPTKIFRCIWEYSALILLFEKRYQKWFQE